MYVDTHSSSYLLSLSFSSHHLMLLCRRQEEDSKNQMNGDRRCAYLERKIQETAEEIQRQEKARMVQHLHILSLSSLLHYVLVIVSPFFPHQGVESLQKAYKEQPDFTDEKGADDVTRQLFEVMLKLWVESRLHCHGYCRLMRS